MDLIFYHFLLLILCSYHFFLNVIINLIAIVRCCCQYFHYAIFHYYFSICLSNDFVSTWLGKSLFRYFLSLFLGTQSTRLFFKWITLGKGSELAVDKTFRSFMSVPFTACFQGLSRKTTFVYTCSDVNTLIKACWDILFNNYDKEKWNYSFIIPLSVICDCVCLLWITNFRTKLSYSVIVSISNNIYWLSNFGESCCIMISLKKQIQQERMLTWLLWYFTFTLICYFVAQHFFLYYYSISLQGRKVVLIWYLKDDAGANDFVYNFVTSIILLFIWCSIWQDS